MIDGLILCGLIAATFVAVSRLGFWMAEHRRAAQGDEACR